MSQASPPEPVFAADFPKSAFYDDYRQAFSEAVGLPISLHAPGTFRVNPDDSGIPEFCRTMAANSKLCGVCADMHRHLQDPSGRKVLTMKCFAGMSSSAIPIRVDDHPAAYLHTGHVFLKEPGQKRRERVESALEHRGTEAAADASPRRTRVMTESQYQSSIRVLEVFAHRLAAEAAERPEDPSVLDAAYPAVVRAMQLIQAQCEYPWTLEDLASRCHISPNYLSELFPQTAGTTYTGYLAQVRIGRAIHALRDPHRRISEIAFAVGFRSLSQFNRVFKDVTGRSPSEYRAASAAVARE